ncbi:MAG: hypothetical protein QOE15_1505, partial [Acidimicrobiaceae bacterium]|nr:hypothetical protein [Acidimicrobiaceae bacterium]
DLAPGGNHRSCAETRRDPPRWAKASQYLLLAAHEVLSSGTIPGMDVNRAAREPGRSNQSERHGVLGRASTLFGNP